MLPEIERGMGAVGLTLSAGLSGWIEFLLLRRALQERIGSTELPRLFATKIWAAALVAGVGGWGAGHFIHLGIRWANLGVVMAAFGVLYAGADAGAAGAAGPGVAVAAARVMCSNSPVISRVCSFLRGSSSWVFPPAPI